MLTGSSEKADAPAQFVYHENESIHPSVGFGSGIRDLHDPCGRAKQKQASMKTLVALFLFALACYYWHDDNSNRSDLENAKKQIQQLTQERDQAMQQLKQFGYTSPQPAATGQANWFQKHLQEKSALDRSNSRGQPSGRH